MPQPRQPAYYTDATQALFLVLAPASLSVALYPMSSPHALWLVTLALSMSFLITSWYHRSELRWTRRLATVALVTWSSLALYLRPHEPSRGLFILMSTMAVLAFIWPNRRLRAQNEHLDSPWLSLLVSSSLAIVVGLDRWQTGPTDTALIAIGLAATYLVPVGLAARSPKEATLCRPKELVLIGAVALIPLIDGALALNGHAVGLSPFALFAPFYLLYRVSQRSAPRSRLPDEPSPLDAILLHPSRVLVLSFVLLCGLGTFMLKLPLSTVAERSISWTEAAFTAVSATCVTGLSVVDTARTFSLVGQVLILLLIQIGGLGIMFFSAAATVLLGRRLSLSHERAAVDLIGANDRADLKHAVRAVLLVTGVTELLGALLLMVGFVSAGDSYAMAAWRGLFTSISAFCNAGFALQSDSLVSYAQRPFILSVISLIIVIGGLGPAVIGGVIGWGGHRRRSLHSQIVLWTSALLLLFPTLLIAVLEWNTTLVSLSFTDKLSNALFQAVTLRTAGFNSIDLSAVHPTTWTLMIFVMFVGGSPASTAGGVKTTTIAVVILSVFAVIRGKEHVELFGRTLPTRTILRATAVTTIAVLGACLALAAIQLTQSLPLDVALFEVVSALATVGLSTGGTSQLDEIGQFIIIVCMFTGRVGPLSLFMFLSFNSRGAPTRVLPTESVPIG